MTDVMLDFEAFGNGKNACIVQVAAVYFDRHTGEIGKEFKANIDAQSAIASGAEMDASAVYWWLSQEKAAIDSILQQPRREIFDVMDELNWFLNGATAIWSHATYDFVILTETLKRLEIRPAFSYRATRDIRTLLDLAGIQLKDQTLNREGVHHDSLDDCKFQVQYCVPALRKLGGK
jgi:hypothetical protein